MKKSAYFASRPSAGWPHPKDLERYFLAPPGQRWFFETENESGSLTAEGVDGTEHLEANKGRIDINLMMWGNLRHGVLLMYEKWGGSVRETYTSKGDLSRLRELVRGLHDTPLPVGLFVPFDIAWKAVKEFIETDGELPKSIAWIANRDLPPGTFPDP
ncbi:MAG: Imm1 family immunity protein [Bradyrhizobium sp.]